MRWREFSHRTRLEFLARSALQNEIDRKFVHEVSDLSKPSLPSPAQHVPFSSTLTNKRRREREGMFSTYAHKVQAEINSCGCGKLPRYCEVPREDAPETERKIDCDDNCSFVMIFSLVANLRVFNILISERLVLYFASQDLLVIIYQLPESRYTKVVFGCSSRACKCVAVNSRSHFYVLNTCDTTEMVERDGYSSHRKYVWYQKLLPQEITIFFTLHIKNNSVIHIR